MRKFFYNRLLHDLIGIDEISLDNPYQGFGIFNYIQSSDWVQFYTNFLTLKSDNSINDIVLERNELQLLNAAFEEVEGQFLIYRQVYLEEKILTQEIYFVFYQPQQTQDANSNDVE